MDGKRGLRVYKYFAVFCTIIKKFWTNTFIINVYNAQKMLRALRHTIANNNVTKGADMLQWNAVKGKQ